MQSFSTADSTIIGLIDHMNSLYSKLEDMNSLLINTKNNNCNSHMSDSHHIITVLSHMEEHVKKADQLVMLIQSELQFFTKYCLSLNNSLITLRNDLLAKIASRYATQVQMNTSAELYDEANLITKIELVVQPVESKSKIVSGVSMTQLTDVKDYSVLSIVKQFESEINLLLNIKNMVHIDCCEMTTHFMQVRGHISEIKKICTDNDTVTCICGEDMYDGDKCLGTIQSNIMNSLVFVSEYKHAIMKIFQLYQELIHNYDVYMKAIDTYTSFTLECFFDPDANYEF